MKLNINMKSKLVVWLIKPPLSQQIFTLFPFVMLAKMLIDSLISDGLTDQMSLLSMMSFGAIIIGFMVLIVYAGVKKQ